MGRISKLLFFVYILFLSSVSWFFMRSGNALVSPEYLRLFVSVTSVFVAMLFILWRMGRTPAVKVFSTHDTVAIYRLGRRGRRVWISCAWGVDDDGIFLSVFGKEKARVALESVKDVSLDGGKIRITTDTYMWLITADEPELLKELLRKRLQNEN